MQMHTHATHGTHGTHSMDRYEVLRPYFERAETMLGLGRRRYSTHWHARPPFHPLPAHPPASPNVHIHTCMHTRTHALVLTHTRARTHARTHAHICACACAHARKAYMHACMLARTYARACMHGWMPPLTQACADESRRTCVRACVCIAATAAQPVPELCLWLIWRITAASCSIRAEKPAHDLKAMTCRP